MYYALSDRLSDSLSDRTTNGHSLVSVVGAQGIEWIHYLLSRSEEPTAAHRIAGLDTM